MTKIAIISEHASPIAVLGGVNNGGQNVYVAHLARQLSLAGYQVDVFTRRDHPALPDVVEWEHGVRIFNIDAGPVGSVPKEELFQYMDVFADQVIDILRSPVVPYDLVHANFWMSGWVAIQIKRHLGIPFVITFHALGRVRRIHQGMNDNFPDLRFEIEDRIVAEADRIIAECPQDEHDLLRLYQAIPIRIVMIPCGFDPNEIWPIRRADARRYLGLPAHEPVVLQLGRMVPRKGIDNVIRGIARLRRDYKIRANLVVVGGEAGDSGDTPSQELIRLQAIARKERVEQQVLFAGQKDRSELRFYYSAADVFATTPWYEPFGITPLEAMACGVPVVGSNVGGIKYTVIDDATGLLVAPNDPAGLARALARLLKDPELMRSYGQNGRRRVNAEFTWEKVARSIAALYEDVLRPAAQPVDLDPARQIQYQRDRQIGFRWD
jgi:glycosyltransferase involved in cell wall biosynthesis